MFKNFDITVDTTKGVKKRANTIITNDSKTIKSSITIIQSGEPVYLTGSTVRLSVKNQDKKTVFQDCTIIDAANGKCEITFDTQVYIVPGLHLEEVMNHFTADKLYVTCKVSNTANKGILDEGPFKSTNEFQSINRVIEDVKGIVVDLWDNEAGIDAQAESDLEVMAVQLVEL
ncbi:BppU family phage baseplate upper protein [Peribacillus frigoritolerans]|uniref:BppU family phage baseplate upper protein n=1 Tax=Peribacillus frigoritolerans TaxID=450367 RepID=A0AAJ1QPS1_9BACI|nr:BppU family phage baseplate upper protein [Peribacillus frigoritolerans]MDM5285526.1 BppU family phage baseplate upper protein [Peribacillus frigoritolerans]